MLSSKKYCLGRCNSLSEKALLTEINTILRELGVNYYYMVNDSTPITYPYVVGEYHEIGYSYEDNATIGEMLLNAWTRGTENDLIDIKDLVKNGFKNYQTVISEGNKKTAIAINYIGKSARYTGEEDLKRIEIRLETKYWESD